MKEQKAGWGEEPWTAAFCYVLAPVLASYVLWVLTEAWKSGKKRLYFLARDGYIMYLTAKYFCEVWQLPLECRYLYCSRYALRSGEYKLLGDKSLDYICLGGMKVTLEKMMQRGGLTDQEVCAAADYMGWRQKMQKPLSYEQVKALKPQLKNNPLFMDRMLDHSKEAYPHVLGYLRQEGLLEEVPYAVVDSGWTGSIQRSINRLLESAGCRKKAEGYYFGLYEYVKGAEPELYHTWYFAPENGNGKKAFFCNNLFECIFSSPEGMAKGYVVREGKYVPAFAAEGNPNWKQIEAGSDILLRYARYYAESVGKCGMADCGKGRAGRDEASYGKGNAGRGEDSIWKAGGSAQAVLQSEEEPEGMRLRTEREELEGGRPSYGKQVEVHERSCKVRKSQKEKGPHGEMRVISRLLSSFMGKPSRGEAQAFGRYVFDDDVTGEEKRTIAYAFTSEEVKEGKFLRRLLRYVLGKEHPVLQSAWPEACIALSEDAGSMDLFQTALYKFLLYSKKSLEHRRRSGRHMR